MTTKREILERLSKGEISQEEADQQISAINEPVAEDESEQPTPVPPPKKRGAGCIIAVIAAIVAGFILLCLIFLFILGLFIRVEKKSDMMREKKLLAEDQMRMIREAQQAEEKK